MTFASPTARFLFHQLPTHEQVEFSDMEAWLAKRKKHLHIASVMTFAGRSEIVVRISFDDDSNSVASDSGACA